jgi:predicted transcriptional regulator
MTRLLDEAIQKIRSLPDSDQDEAADILMSIAARARGPVSLDDDTRAAIREGVKDARDGRFVSDKEMAAFFKHHGL